MKYVIEKQKGKVTLHERNCIVQDITDMEELDFWEERLEWFKQPYIIAYRKLEGKVLYSVFTKKRGGIFQ